MFKISIAGGFVALALALPASAQIVEQRMDVKGLRLGDTLAQMQAVAKLKCTPDKTKTFDTICHYANSKDQTFAGERVQEVQFGLFNGVLDSVHFYFSSATYEPIRLALDGKFGEMEPRGPSLLRSYMMNGDRAHLMYVERFRALLMFEAAAGKDERARRVDASKARVRSDT